MERLNPLRPIKHLASYLLHLSGDKGVAGEVKPAQISVIEGVGNE